MIPVSSARNTFSGCHLLMLIPIARTSPSSFRLDAARCQRSSSAHVSLHTWNCCRSTVETPRFVEALLRVLTDVIGGIDLVERVFRHAPATSDSSAESSSPNRAAFRGGASACARAAFRCGRRHTPTPYRRSYSPARSHDRATRATPRRRSRSTLPSPTSRNQSRRRPTRCRQKVDSASLNHNACRYGVVASAFGVASALVASALGGRSRHH